MSLSMASGKGNREQAFGLLVEAVTNVVGRERASAFNNLLKAKPAQLPRVIEVAKQRFRSFPPNVREKIRDEVDRRFVGNRVEIRPPEKTGRAWGDSSPSPAKTETAKGDTPRPAPQPSAAAAAEKDKNADAIAALAEQGREITLDDLLSAA